MDFSVDDRIIYLVRHGSHAYGTSTATSDEDVKGVCVPPFQYYTGFLNHFEQEERLASKGHPQDRVVYAVEKFFRLAADCNPNIIEVLYVDDGDVLRTTEWGERLRSHRDEFLSRRVRYTFSGYAHSQLKRIQAHKRWLLQSETYDRPRPTRDDFGLPPASEADVNSIAMAQAEVNKKLDEWNVDMSGLDPAEKVHLQARLTELFAQVSVRDDYLWEKAARFVFDDASLIHTLQEERRYANFCDDWRKYHEWKRSRNSTRAELEAKFGYDTKHAGHLVRLLRMCKEILSGQGVIVKRPDRDELLAIRAGAWKYDDLVAYAAKVDAECDILYKSSPLPNKPNSKRLDDLCSSIVDDYTRRNG